MGILDPLYAAVTWVILHIHTGLSYVLEPTSGAAWALSIVLLTACIRVLLFPLFVKQIQSSRKMQELQPKMKELQRKYKNDRQRLNQEMMRLYQENGANPLGGCLPLLVQIPIFISLFRVLNTIAQRQTTDWGLTQDVVESASNASIFGAPIASRFLNSSMAPGTSTDAFVTLAGSSTSARIVALVLVVVSGVSMFLTMRHSMRRSTAMQAGSDNPAANMQKMMLFMAPLFSLFALWLPIGVLIYIVTNNAWTLAQNYFIYWKYPAAGSSSAASSDAESSQPAASGSDDSDRSDRSDRSGGSGGGLLGRRGRTAPASNPPSPPPQRPVRQQPVNRPRSKRSGGRKR